MITINALEQTTNTESATQDTAGTAAPVDAVATIALDEVNGGWMYSPYGNPYAAYGNPYMAYGSPYAAARYEAHLERRAVRAASRWWGY